MLTFYEFQQRYPDDEACLEQIMVSATAAWSSIAGCVASFLGSTA